MRVSLGYLFGTLLQSRGRLGRRGDVDVVRALEELISLLTDTKLANSGLWDGKLGGLGGFARGEGNGLADDLAGGLSSGDLDGCGFLGGDGLAGAGAEHHLDADGMGGLIELVDWKDVHFGGALNGVLSLLAHELRVTGCDRAESKTENEKRENQLASHVAPFCGIRTGFRACVALVSAPHVGQQAQLGRPTLPPAGAGDESSRRHATTRAADRLGLTADPVRPVHWT